MRGIQICGEPAIKWLSGGKKKNSSTGTSCYEPCPMMDSHHDGRWWWSFMVASVININIIWWGFHASLLILFMTDWYREDIIMKDHILLVKWLHLLVEQEEWAQLLYLSNRLTFFIYRITNKSFGRWRSRFDNTFKGNRVSVELKKWFQPVRVCLLLANNKLFTSIIQWWIQVWAWGYSHGRQLVVWCRTLREDRMRLRIMSCRLDVFQDIYWGKKELLMKPTMKSFIIYSPTSKTKCSALWIPHIGIEFSIS